MFFGTVRLVFEFLLVLPVNRWRSTEASVPLKWNRVTPVPDRRA